MCSCSALGTYQSVLQAWKRRHVSNLLPSRMDEKSSPPDPQNLPWTFTRDLSLFDLLWLIWFTPIHHSTPVKWQFGDVPHSWRYPNVSSWWVIFHVVYPIAITSMVHPCRKACWNLHGTFPRVKNNQNVVVFLHGFFHGFLGCPMSEQTQIELWARREVEFMSVSMIFEIVKRGLKMIVSIFNNHESPKNGTWWLIYSLLKL